MVAPGNPSNDLFRKDILVKVLGRLEQAQESRGKQQEHT
jgi:hypothetical protein